MSEVDTMIFCYVMTGVIIIVALSLGIYIHKSKKLDELVKTEFFLINPGDIYECKIDLDNNGISSSNPYNHFKYKVISKKEGWVEVEKLNNIKEGKPTIIYVSVKELLKKKYKCINNFR